MATPVLDTDISVLLPTRGRTKALETSVMSLLSRCHHPQRMELLLAFDDDDKESSQWFIDELSDKITDQGGRYSCWEVPRFGYIRLNQYVNYLAEHARGQWMMFWNDDAIMESSHWDDVITQYHGQFRVLRMPTHREHPYAIFPIVPRQWFDTFGYISPHQISDAWVSQIAYLLDIMQTVPIAVKHDRHDLTGNNKDSTYDQRIMLEGRPSDPRDFNHVTWRNRRLQDANKIATMLEHQGTPMTWFRKVLAGQQDAWEKMISDEFDPNHQVTRYPVHAA
jgi:hypothetical protein